MTPVKVSKFFVTAINRTKSGELSWSRISVSDGRHFASFDSERSFSAKYGSGKIVLLQDDTDDIVNCWIKADKDLSYQQIGDDNDPNLRRLYNIVYSQFPSVESFIDAFINGSPIE